MWDLAGHGLAITKSAKVQSPTMYLGHFMKPYFRDKVTGLGPPANQDTKEKATQGIKSFDRFIITSWKQRDKEKLKLSITSDVTQRLLQPKLLRVEYLNKKLELSRQEEANKGQTEQIGETKVEYLNKKLEPSREEEANKGLTKQIGETEREMAKINQMTQRQLLGNRFDDHDWIKIANIDFDGSRRAEDIKRVWQNSEHPSINQAEWSSQELERLVEMAEQGGCVDWEWIASQLQTNRTAYMCLQKYQEVNKDLKRREWTEQEDQMLTELVQKMRVGSFIPYTKIAYFMEGRNGSQLLYRWTKSLEPTMKRGPWSPAEDALLLKAVMKYGSRDWFKIQELIPGRIDAQCRGRYLNGLNDHVRKGKWTPEEESHFKVLLEKHGVGKWSKIAADMSVRTDNQCLSKWRIIAGIKAKQQAMAKTQNRRKRRAVWESSSEESSEDSEDDKFLEEIEMEMEEEEEEEEEDLEDAQELERRKLRVKRRKPAEPLMLDVDRWVPVVENEPDPAEKTANGQGSNEVTEQPADAWKADGQNRLGRPKSSKIWRILAGPASAVPSASGPDEKLREREPAAQAGAPAPGAPPEIAPSSAAGEVPREPPQIQGESKKARCKAATSLAERNLDRNLLAEMIRWTTVRPVCREVDILRERLEATVLRSTPVFILLIQVFRIDKKGCLQTIREKMNTDAQRLSERTQRDDQLKRDVYLRQMKDDAVGVGNGQTMGIPESGCAPPRVKPKTVLELLAEKRRAKARAANTLGPLRQLIIQQPLRVAVLAQSAAAAGKGPAPQAPEQTRPTSPIQTRLSSWRKRPATRSSARQAMRGQPASTVPARVLMSGVAADQPGPTPPSSQIQPAPPAQIAAPVKPGPAKSRERRLQPIAPAPVAQPTLQPSGVIVPLMLPNSTVPIMAVLTPQGLLCIPPSALAGLPNPNVQSLATGATASQPAPCSSIISTVPASGMVSTCSTVPSGGTVSTCGTGSSSSTVLSGGTGSMSSTVLSGGTVPSGGTGSMRSTVLVCDIGSSSSTVLSGSTVSAGGTVPSSGTVSACDTGSTSRTVLSGGTVPAGGTVPSGGTGSTSSTVSGGTVSACDTGSSSSTVLSGGTVSACTAVQGPAGALPVSAQLAVNGPTLTPMQTPISAIPAPIQPLTSPSSVLHAAAPPSSSSTPIQQTQAPTGSGTSPVPPASTHAPSLSAGAPALGAVQHPAAKRFNPSVSVPLHTAHPNQGVGDSRLTAGVPGAGCSSINPSSSAQRKGTEPPAARSQPGEGSIDFTLVSNDQESVMKDWLQGEGGVQVPGMPTALPYLPPFTSTLRAFSNLLLHKRVLEQNLSGLGPTDHSQATDPKNRLQAARVLVTDRLRNNTAHQLLKARFLSAFTLPAFLATLPPQGSLTTVGSATGALSQDSAEESEYTETDGESEDDIEGSQAQCAADDVANRELDQPLEIAVADLSSGCNLPGSLETIVGEPSAPEPPSDPESEAEVLTRWRCRLRKRP